MNTVKLNRTHNLYHWGYTHAFRFRRRDKIFFKIRDFLKENYANSGEWRIHQADRRSPIWVGVKDETMLTLIMLSYGNS